MVSYLLDDFPFKHSQFLYFCALQGDTFCMLSSVGLIVFYHKNEKMYVFVLVMTSNLTYTVVPPPHQMKPIADKLAITFLDLNLCKSSIANTIPMFGEF
jgi:hypothetical protein